jgi:4-carboxymuconolactone decarboxylase
VHLKGAIKNGCSVEQIQEVLLLLALYCGIPAANEAHRVAADGAARGEADVMQLRTGPIAPQG